MPLNWNIEKCKDYKELTEADEWPVTESLVFATMPVGIHTITEKNYEEFWARLNLNEKLSGTYLNRAGKPSPITLEQVKRRIGLTTNASTLTRQQFVKAAMERYFKEVLGK